MGDEVSGFGLHMILKRSREMFEKCGVDNPDPAVIFSTKLQETNVPIHFLTTNAPVGMEDIKYL